MKTNPTLLYTKNLFGPQDEISGKLLRLVERNSQGDCCCVFDGKMGTNLVDVDYRDIAPNDRTTMNHPRTDAIRSIMKTNKPRFFKLLRKAAHPSVQPSTQTSKRKSSGSSSGKVRPRIERFEEECWFIIPAVAVSTKGGFAIAFGWLKWHIEIKWPDADLLPAHGDETPGARES